MSVPLDRLYNFLYYVAKQDILIYRFFPHGSTKWQDLAPLFLPSDNQTKNLIMCIFHDQDPFNPDWTPKVSDFFKTLTRFKEFYCNHILFVHSQKNMNINDLKIFNAIPVYYWSHALIALDWFRYAKLDPAIVPVTQTQPKPFLIYNRAWSGTREYRFKFLHELIQHTVQDYCNVKFSQYDNDQHYTKHFFKNKNFACDCKFEDFFAPNTAPSNASADYCLQDYLNSNIEIVLETVFDTTYWHLTEKILRPIAVGKSFLLAASPRSLEYLRFYGFQTFSPWIDETYDQIPDPIERLQAIAKEMKRIVNLSVDAQQEIFHQCQKIADYNKKRFFSDEFNQTIVNEFRKNLVTAVDQVKSLTFFNGPMP